MVYLGGLCKVAKNEGLIVNFAELTDEELYALRDNLARHHAIYDDEWAKELKEIASVPNFDQYSFWGERKIKKLAKKYAQKTEGLTYLEKLTMEEIFKRDKFKEEQMYSGKGTHENQEMSVDEFIEREQIKTESYKTDDN